MYTNIYNFVDSMTKDSIIITIIALITPTLGLCYVFAIFFFEILKIHDHFYDKLIIKWRERYDLTYIIPNLIIPIIGNLPSGILNLALTNRKKFMDIFYDYVGDGKVGITDNTRVRFYEKITLYWITQINEIFLLIFLIGTPIYKITFPIFTLQSSKFYWIILLSIILIITNRWLMRKVLKSVAIATEDQIREIYLSEENKGKIISSFIALVKDIRGEK